MSSRFLLVSFDTQKTLLTLVAPRSGQRAVRPEVAPRGCRDDALKDLKGLTTLTLNLSGSRVSSLDALKDLKGLTTLQIELNANLVDLSSFRSFEKLETLTITHSLRYELAAFPKSLTTLHLSDGALGISSSAFRRSLAK